MKFGREVSTYSDLLRISTAFDSCEATDLGSIAQRGTFREFTHARIAMSHGVW